MRNFDRFLPMASSGSGGVKSVQSTGTDNEDPSGLRSVTRGSPHSCLVVMKGNDFPRNG
jgi:hypothetical protein